MPQSAEEYAGKTFRKQGLDPAPAGRPPRVGSEAVFGPNSEIRDAGGRKLGDAMRSSDDSVGLNSSGFKPSVLSQMMDKYAGAVDRKNIATKYGAK